MANMQNSNSGNREIPVKAVRAFTFGNDELRKQRIAKKAYELYECRGCCHGRDLDDWLEAERMISIEAASPAQSRGQTAPQRRRRLGKV